VPVNFDDAIPFFGDTVAATGPEHPKEKILDISVWIWQSLPDCTGDAAATGTASHAIGKEEHPRFLRVDGASAHEPGRWLLPVKKIGTAELQEGRAYAVAVARMKDVEDGDKPEVGLWQMQIELQRNEERVNAAKAAFDPQKVAAGEDPGDVLRNGELAVPLEFKGL